MSLRAMLWAFDQQDLPPTTKLVLLALADEANDDGGSCFPGQQRLARRASVSVRTVQRHLTELEEAGLIRRWVRNRANGTGRTSDGYQLAVDGPLDQHDNLSRDSGDATNTTPVSPHVPVREPVTTEPPHRSPPTDDPTLFEDPPQPEPTPEPEPKTRTRRKPETPIPDGWQPDDKMRAWAAEHVPTVDIDHETGVFIDHAHANDRRQRDWDASFRTWLRRAVKWSSSTSGGGRTTRMEPSESTDPADYVPEGAMTGEELYAELIAQRQGGTGG